MFYFIQAETLTWQDFIKQVNIATRKLSIPSPRIPTHAYTITVIIILRLNRNLGPKSLKSLALAECEGARYPSTIPPGV